MPFGAAAEKSGWRLLRWRQQPCEDVEQDHHRAGKQHCCNEAEGDDGRVDAALVGKTGGDAHDLGVAAVNQETLVHLGFPGMSGFRRSAAKSRPKPAEAR
jgi:hypothetical protein